LLLGVFRHGQTYTPSTLRAFQESVAPLRITIDRPLNHPSKVSEASLNRLTFAQRQNKAAAKIHIAAFLCDGVVMNNGISNGADPGPSNIGYGINQKYRYS